MATVQFCMGGRRDEILCASTIWNLFAIYSAIEESPSMFCLSKRAH
jgi:hypothetical protein